MSKNLVKEVITTETEKFTEDGKIKERVKETREKIYSNEIMEQEFPEEASKVEKDQEVKEEVKKETNNEDLIKAAALAADKANANKKEEEANAQQATTNPYNVLSRTTPFPMGSSALTPPPVFPWEAKK